MVKVEFSVSEDKKNLILKIKGHAGQAEPGRDLVCAVCSGFAYQLAQILCDLYELGKLRKKPTIRLGAGDAEIVAKPISKAYGEVLYAYSFSQTGFKVLAHNFPQYVELKEFDVETLKKAEHK